MTIFWSGRFCCSPLCRARNSILCRRFPNANFKELVVKKNNASSQEGSNNRGKIRYPLEPSIGKVIEASLKGGRDKQTITMMVTDRTIFSLCRRFSQTGGRVSSRRGRHQ